MLHRWTNVRDLQLTFRQPSTCLRPNGASMLCLARCLSCNSCAKLGLVRGSITMSPNKVWWKIRWSMDKDSRTPSLSPVCYSLTASWQIGLTSAERCRRACRETSAWHVARETACKLQTRVQQVAQKDLWNLPPILCCFQNHWVARHWFHWFMRCEWKEHASNLWTTTTAECRVSRVSRVRRVGQPNLLPQIHLPDPGPPVRHEGLYHYPECLGQRLRLGKASVDLNWAMLSVHHILVQGLGAWERGDQLTVADCHILVPNVSNRSFDNEQYKSRYINYCIQLCESECTIAAFLHTLPRSKTKGPRVRRISGASSATMCLRKSATVRPLLTPSPFWSALLEPSLVLAHGDGGQQLLAPKRTC